MRDLSPQWDAWDLAEGRFFGEYKASGRVTVQPDWMLGLSPRNVGSSKKGPFRWWQKDDNSQEELEIPNVKSIQIDRSVDDDAGSCTIILYNQWHEDLGTEPSLDEQLGEPGYFSFNRGKNPDAVARWNQQVNDWTDVLVENAMLRTYQGYGGYDENGNHLPLMDSITGGYTPMTGVWLIDRVQLGSNGMITLTCRDMMKLLIDQLLYKPLVPSKEYPLKYYRWVYRQVNHQFDARKPVVTGGMKEWRPRYRDSSTDRWYGHNYRLHGHRGTDSVDGRLDTFALSVGNSHPSRPFCTDWFEYEVNAHINEIYMHPWGGNYTMFISVLENGRWVDGGGGFIPYQMYPPTDTGANIPFVTRVGTPWEQGKWYKLPRMYNAQRVRITFRDHRQSPWGPWFYRCGIRDVRVKINTRNVSIPLPWTMSASPHYHGEGYYIVDDVGKVFAFGDCIRQPQNSPKRPITAPVVAIEARKGLPMYHAFQGYWTLQSNGRVNRYGAVGHYGDIGGKVGDFVDMAGTHTGQGYWLLRKDGAVFAFGDAANYPGMPVTPALQASGRKYGIHWPDYAAKGITGHPTAMGFWVCNGNGEVRARGAAAHKGQLNSRAGFINPPRGCEWISDIQATSDGEGYWMLSITGRVFAYGSARHFGQGTDTPKAADVASVFKEFTWSIIPSMNEDGYYLLKGGGGIKTFGNAPWWGQIGSSGQVRRPGNYRDYADIVKEILLWSGFWLGSDNPPSTGKPLIYGNIESTGAWADEPLPDDMFDKKPPIDVLNQIKEIVGYQLWVDQEGAVRFESPNWWASGNFFYNGLHTDFIPEVDERNQLLSYGITATDEPLRSEIIIANGNPDGDNKGTIVTRIKPQTGASLRGMVKPAMWFNDVFLNKQEQKIMAELIALHIWFKKRVGSVECIGNPAIDIGDQVKIWERVTGESYVHYVRGVSSTMDLDTGVYTMNLQTNWLGDADDWVITKDSLGTTGVKRKGNIHKMQQRVAIKS